MGKRSLSSDVLPDIADLTIHSPPPPIESTTLYPKISGKVKELIHNYRYRNKIFDPVTKEYMPGPPENPLIVLTGTVKLHGTHADIVVNHDDTMRLQSRNRLSLDIERDNHEFARSLLPKRIEALKIRDCIVLRWKQLNLGVELRKDCPVIIAGEWIGAGIQKTVAIEKLPTKAFVILSISVNGEWQPVEPYKNIHVEEEGIYNISRGGFYSVTLDIENPGACVEEMNNMTLQVEACCPFGISFGLCGIGEGIVWRPVREDLRSDANLWFKTKGPLHRISTTDRIPKSAGDMEALEKARMFAEAAVTEVRLQQAWEYLGEMGIERDKSGTPKFNGWLCGDVEVEETMKIGELGVDMVILKKAIREIGKKWYFAKLESL